LVPVPDVLIELGLVRDEPVASPPVPAHHYRLPLAAVALALLVLLGGAVPHPRAVPPVIVPATLSDLVQVVADRLYVISSGEPVGVPDKRQTIRAYSLPDVRPLFEQRVAVSGEVTGVHPAGDDLLLVGVRGYADATQSTIAVRPGATDPLWQQPGALVGVSPGGPAVFGSDTVAGFDEDRAVEWRGVDLATGATRWTVRKGVGEQAVTDSYLGDPRRLYVLRTGRLTAYDTRDGRPTAEVELPGMRPASAALWPLGDRLLVSSDATGTTIFGTTAGLTASAHTGHSLSDFLSGGMCGEQICAYGQGGRMVGMDPQTLTERWSLGDDAYGIWTGGYLLTFDPGATRTRITRSDPATGAVSGQVDGWALVMGSGPAFHVRHDGPGAAWFGVLDLDPFRVRPLVSAAGVADDCQIAGQALICRRNDATVGVWRLG
jgi:hypothetical protein